MKNTPLDKLLAAIKALSEETSNEKASITGRLPLATLKIKPSEAFRLRVQKLAIKTKQSPQVVAEQLIEIASGMEVRPVEVCPRNGADVGLGLATVVQCLHKTQNCIRLLESKEAPPADKVQVLREGYVTCIDLLIAADKLSGDTFYNHQTLVTMQVFAFKNNEAITQLPGEIASLEKTIPAEVGDAQKQKTEKLGTLKSDLEARKELATVLIRLGFAPEFTA